MSDDLVLRWTPGPRDYWAAYVRTPVVLIGLVVLGYVTVQAIVDISTGYAAVGIGLLAIESVFVGSVVAYRARRFPRQPMREVGVSTGEDGLRIDVGPTPRTVDWANLHASGHPIGILVRDGATPVVLIPWRAFQNRDRARAFMDLVNSNARGGVE